MAAWSLCTDATCPPMRTQSFYAVGKTRLNSSGLGIQPCPGVFGVKPHLCSKLQFAFMMSSEILSKKIIHFLLGTIPLPITSAAVDEDGAPHGCSTGANITFGPGWRTPRLYPALHPLAGSRWQSILHFHSSQA